jgi:DNA-3-methyladenine glycosylase
MGHNADVSTAPDAPPLGQVPARVWFARPVLQVARDLLGACLTTRSPEGEVTVRITEVEAYGGIDDPASHAYRGRNARNASMFAEPGRLYVYRHLGLHDCVNVVAEPTGQPSAVLLRAGEVIDGAELAWRRRARAGVVDSARQLARGPARLAVCLGLGRSDDGADVTEADGRVVLHRVESVARPGTPAAGPRVGVAGDGASPVRYPWRLWLTNDPTVSAFRPGYRSPASGGAPAGATTSA